jgi:hypothetical protein
MSFRSASVDAKFVLMRSRALLLLAASAAGCGIVSGLDGLGVGEAGVDATAPPDGSDDVADVVTANDANEDAVIDGPAPVLDASGHIACGPNLVCGSPADCCASMSGADNFTYTCALGCPPGVIQLACDDKTDCPQGDNCCFASGVASCQGATTICPTRLCLVDASTTQCTCLPFDAGDGLSLASCK